MNKKKMIFLFFAVCAGAGFSFGLIVRFSGQGSVMAFLGLTSSDVTGEFRDTLYRTAGMRIDGYGATGSVVKDKEPTKMSYDESLILFGKPSSWSAGETSQKANEVENPAELIKAKKIPIVTTKLVSTLEDIGVGTRLEPMPSLSEMEGGSKKIEYGSLTMMSAGKDLERRRPITKQEAKRQAMNERRIAASQNQNAGAVQAAARQLRLSAMNQLRAAARLGQLAMASSDSDAASVLSGSFASGENISPSLQNMAAKGELGGVEEDAAVSITAQVLNSLGITTSGGASGSSGSVGSSDSGSSSGSSEDSSSVLDAGGWVISGGALSALLGSTLIGSSESGCVICGTVDINVSDLLVGPAAPIGPTAQLDQSSLSTALSLSDFKGLTSPVSLSGAMGSDSSGSSGSGLSTALKTTPSTLGTSAGSAVTGSSGGSLKSSGSSGSGGSSSKTTSIPAASSTPKTTTTAPLKK
ncbi:MAG: hypothetical protein HY547_04760 [Elusimicrobia bacterium]|nr:hypothetical protein [Elusimicrobiota bacterium]